MNPIDRRSILKGAAGLGASTVLPDAIQTALAIPAHSVSGTIDDVKHIVVLMQENRSFDHYFGKLRGVRGFSDPRAVRLYDSGKPVFEQPNMNSSGVVQTPDTVLPFRVDIPHLGMAFTPGTPHGWKDAHGAWNSGRNDRWLQFKGKVAMTYMQREDIPFHYALADAFTVCDAYFCSTMASTDPNRYYLWSGWCGQNGSNNPDSPTSGATPGTLALVAGTGNGVPPLGPVVNNSEAGYNWRTYPERLQAAGVTWKVYQDIGTGLTAAGGWGWTNMAYIGNYGDNSLLYFTQYQNAADGSPLANGARTGTNIYNGGAFNSSTLFDQLRADVLADKLPQVSWIAAPEAYSEHSNWPANYGAWYTANVLQALTANPKVWASTVLIVCFDENDGQFDHVVAPTAPMSAAQGKSTVSTANEIYPGDGSSSYPAGPYGLGARVPMLVVSPWSKGGWVNSQVFDHTSIIRFIEQRFGVVEPNITPWRRTVCGDLTSTLDFGKRNASATRLPGTEAYAPPQADVVANTKYTSIAVNLPVDPRMPVQEAGLRPARALPYRLQVDRPAADAGTLTLNFANAGRAGAWLQVRTVNGDLAGGATGPWGYTLEAGKSLSDVWTGQGSNGAVDLSIHGPNGFFRRFAGRTDAAGANLAVKLIERPAGNAAGAHSAVSVLVINKGRIGTTVTVTNVRTGASSHQTLVPGGSFRSDWTLDGNAEHGWYDLKVSASTDANYLSHLSGFVETGNDGVCDPAISEPARRLITARMDSAGATMDMTDALPNSPPRSNP